MSAIGTRTAADLMSRDVYAIQGSLGVKEAAHELLERGFSGAVVTDDDGAPVGVLSMSDIARFTEGKLGAEAIADEATQEMRALGPKHGFMLHVDQFRYTTVRQVMTPAIATVDDTAPIASVLEAMLAGPFHRVFVRSEAGTLVGIISTIDIMRALLEDVGG